MRLKQGFIYVCCGALGLYITDFIFTSLPFQPFLKTTSDYILSLISIFLGVGFSIFGIFYKNTSLLEMFFRFVVMILSYIIFTVFCGSTGITRLLLDILHVKMSPMQDNVSGLSAALYFLIIISIDILAMVIEIVRRVCKNVLNH